MDEEVKETVNIEETVNTPFSPLYVPDRSQKKNNKITIAFVVLLLLCLVGGMIFAVSKLVEAAAGEMTASALAWQETLGEWKSEMENIFAPEPEMEAEKNPNDGELYEEPYEFDEDYDFSQDFHYQPSPEDEYYVELADSIRDDLSYTAEKKNYSFTDEDFSTTVFIEYVTVEGLNFDDKINESLEESAMYYAKQFGENDTTDIEIEVRSYVTYMDEDILSVVIDERYTWDWNAWVDLYCMNFDLKTGSLLYNTSIIEPSEKLAAAFRDMSEYQNGYAEVLEEMSDKDIAEYFAREEALILFYTPVGLEIGFNHSNGWITATLKEYKEYLNKL